MTEEHVQQATGDNEPNPQRADNVAEPLAERPSWLTETVLLGYGSILCYAMVYSYCLRRAAAFGIPAYLVDPIPSDFFLVLAFVGTMMVLLFSAVYFFLRPISKAALALALGWNRVDALPNSGVVTALFSAFLAAFAFAYLLGVFGNRYVLGLGVLGLLTSAVMLGSLWAAKKGRVGKWLHESFWREETPTRASSKYAPFLIVLLAFFGCAAASFGSRVADLSLSRDRFAIWKKENTEYMVVMRSGDLLVSVPFEEVKLGKPEHHLLTPISDSSTSFTSRVVEVPNVTRAPRLQVFMYMLVLAGRWTGDSPASEPAGT